MDQTCCLQTSKMLLFVRIEKEDCRIMTTNLFLKKLIVKSLKFGEKNIHRNVGLYASKKLFLHRTNAKIHGCSSVGRALVSKTRCREFEPLLPCRIWRVGRVVEGARLESVYTSKGYRGFESLTLRWKEKQKEVIPCKSTLTGFFLCAQRCKKGLKNACFRWTPGGLYKSQF